jgi:hypothetical protein
VGNPAHALEKEGLDDMALVRKIRKRLFVQYQPVEVEPMEREDKTVESRYAFVKIVPESATARGAASPGAGALVLRSTNSTPRTKLPSGAARCAVVERTFAAARCYTNDVQRGGAVLRATCFAGSCH